MQQIQIRALIAFISYYLDLIRMAEKGGPAHPDDYKQKAFYAFWIRKLKPISVRDGGALAVPGSAKYWINEFIAIYMALVELDIVYGKNVQKSIMMSPTFFHDLLFYFRYKSVSPHALYLMFHGMYEI